MGSLTSFIIGHQLSVLTPVMDLPTTEARKPFDVNAFSDIILQSSDSVHFYVHSAFLSFVSPSFRDMFSLNRGPAVDQNEKKGGFPIIGVTEDSETLYFLLELIYPVEESPFYDLGVFRKVCKAAQKYLMDGIEDKLRKWILTSQLLKNEPFRVYVIAIDLHWEAVALVAARGTLQVSLENLPFIDELKDISGAEFYRFLDYRFRCDKASGCSGGLITLMEDATDSMSSPQPNTTQADPPAKAPEPFDSTVNGNVILRSSDLVDFFVIEGLIRLVSPFFDGMFPLKKHHEIDGRPIINLSEDSKVLHALLSMIYPHIDEPVMGDYHLCKQVLQAARKYKISIIEKKLRKLAMALVDKEPLRMYAMAISLGWDEVAKIAALNTLSQPLRDMTFVQEMCQITGADLFSLMRYRFTCAEEACKVAKDGSMHTKHGFGNLVGQVNNGYTSSCIYCGYRQSGGYYNGGYNCPSCNRYQNRQNGSPLNTTPNVSGEVNISLKNCPRGATYKSIYVSEFARIAGLTDTTRYCLQLSTIDTMMGYRDGLVTAIEDAVLKVPLKPSDMST
ncbi:hypothetical protein AX15_003084 [Amanita polypyramis BW_CC]|nr:hypothetical protein AX15_003084 [Amanita polypyramis BW_CC]